MTQIANAMYVIKGDGGDDGPDWTAYVLCTTIGCAKEHGWLAEGYTEWQAINELQEQMKVAK